MAVVLTDVEEFKSMMLKAGIAERFHLDFARIGAGTVAQLMTFDGGKLQDDSVAAAVIHALLAAAAANSALQEPDDIPLRSHGGSDAAQRRAEYVTLHGQFMVLAAMARQHFPTVIKRMVDDAAPPPPTESSDETKLKDSGAIAAKMTKKAEQAYNIRFVGGRKASDKQLVKTALALERGKLDVSRLDGGEYGKVSFVEKQAQPLSLSTGGRIVELPEGETLTRLAKGLATIGAVVDSFVIGGLTEIDSAKQTLASSHGKLTDGKQYQFDMTTGRMLLGCYVALADHMTCKDLLTHFQETLLPHLGSQMAAGHSLCSAAMDAINNSAWMRPESYAKVVPAQAATSSGPSAQEFEKMQKRLKHFENENAAMKAAKDKRAAQSPSGRGASRGYRPDYRRDDDHGDYHGRGRGGSDREYERYHDSYDGGGGNAKKRPYGAGRGN